MTKRGESKAYRYVGLGVLVVSSLWLLVSFAAAWWDFSPPDDDQAWCAAIADGLPLAVGACLRLHTGMPWELADVVFFAGVVVCVLLALRRWRMSRALMLLALALGAYVLLAIVTYAILCAYSGTLDRLTLQLIANGDVQIWSTTAYVWDSTMAVSYGLRFLPGILLVGLLVWKWLARPRIYGAGRCPTCGYDLRGSTGERCSECGEAIGGEVRGRISSMARRPSDASARGSQRSQL